MHAMRQLARCASGADDLGSMTGYGRDTAKARLRRTESVGKSLQAVHFRRWWA
jgi:hypothetical protein